MALFDFHHLIPNSLADHEVFMALQTTANPFTRWTLKNYGDSALNSFCFGLRLRGLGSHSRIASMRSRNSLGAERAADAFGAAQGVGLARSPERSSALKCGTRSSTGPVSVRPSPRTGLSRA